MNEKSKTAEWLGAKPVILERLQKKYPDDGDILALSMIEELERQAKLTATSNPAGAAPIGTHTDLAAPIPTYYDEAETVNQIIKESKELLKNHFREPVYAIDILAELRKKNILLPHEDKKATNKITALYSRNQHIFKKVPGAGSKATARWYIQPNV